FVGSPEQFPSLQPERKPIPRLLEHGDDAIGKKVDRALREKLDQHSIFMPPYSTDRCICSGKYFSTKSIKFTTNQAQTNLHVSPTGKPDSDDRLFRQSQKLCDMRKLP